MFRDMNLARIPLNRHLVAVAVILTLLVPAYSQQEVAPTWYDPWKAPSNTLVYRPQQTRIAHRENRTRISSGAEARKDKTEQIERAARERKRPRQLAAAK